MVVWLCGCVAVWLCGCVAVWLCLGEGGIYTTEVISLFCVLCALFCSAAAAEEKRRGRDARAGVAVATTDHDLLLPSWSESPTRLPTTVTTLDFASSATPLLAGTKPSEAQQPLHTDEVALPLAMQVDNFRSQSLPSGGAMVPFNELPLDEQVRLGEGVAFCRGLHR